MIFILLVAAAMGVGTWVVGWLAVPIMAIPIGFAFRNERAVSARIGLGAVVAWGVLLGIDAVSGPIGRLTSTLGGAMELPGFALLAVTLVFPGLLAWSAAAIGVAIGQRGDRTPVAAAPATD